jgi:hypothetical protein
MPYANSYNVGARGLDYYFKGTFVTVTNAHGWADYVLDLAPEGDFDPTKVTAVGVMIQTGTGKLGDGTTNPIKPNTAVIYVDSVWLEGACTPANCAMGLTTPPPSATITDFSDAVADPISPGNYRYGAGTTVHGGTATFASGTLGTLSLAGGALTFSASIEATSGTNQYAWNGFAVYIDGPACVNASAYTGVSFSLSSLTGTCALDFVFSDADHSPPSDDADRGICLAASCLNPHYPITASTMMVPFNATPGIAGVPATSPNRAKLTGVQFIFKPPSAAACSGSVTVDNVKLY